MYLCTLARWRYIKWFKYEVNRRKRKRLECGNIEHSTFCYSSFFIRIHNLQCIGIFHFGLAKCLYITVFSVKCAVYPISNNVNVRIFQFESGSLSTEHCFGSWYFSFSIFQLTQFHFICSSIVYSTIEFIWSNEHWTNILNHKFIAVQCF